ncbi:MAG: rod shape-determining protein [Clostridia bacterium]|nr:rod shape-determining protein [Clostridia bacterium]
MGRFSPNDIGIDLGTSSILIHVKGQGVVLNEPSIAAVDRASGRLIAIGGEARRMAGREPGSVLIIRPMRDGVISNFDITARMLASFLQKTVGKHRFFKPRALVCMPSTVSEAEKRCIVEAVTEAGARFCYLIEEPIAAAIGAGLDVLSPEGNMVVDIGGGTADVAVISRGSIILSESLRVAGDRMDLAISRYLEQKHRICVGERTAEDLKWNYGKAYPDKEQTVIEIRGRSLVTGQPDTVPLGSNEMIEATAEPVAAILSRVQSVFERTPPELAADIMKNGILLTGGGAQLAGLDRYLAEKTGVPCRVAEDPMTCVVRGTGLVLEDFEKYNCAVYTYRRGDYLNS